MAICLDPDESKPVLYGLVLEGAADQPLMLADRILLFHDPARAERLVLEYGGAMNADKVDVSKPFFWCDIAQTLHLLQAGGVDSDACVLSAVNALLDLVRATGVRIPPDTKAALHSIADYCTMNKDLTKYLEEEGDHSSEALVGAVLWCVGLVAVKAKVV
ncbi:MAG: hypothetical protein R3B48_30225 [Kofleriaceae bacterium]